MVVVVVVRIQLNTNVLYCSYVLCFHYNTPENSFIVKDYLRYVRSESFVAGFKNICHGWTCAGIICRAFCGFGG
jgi:hypothetical protein